VRVVLKNVPLFIMGVPSYKQPEPSARLLVEYSGIPKVWCKQRNALEPASLQGLLERETGVEPATSSLGSWHSTTELLPLWFLCKYNNNGIIEP
jgi:hypothetical protein